MISPSFSKWGTENSGCPRLVQVSLHHFMLLFSIRENNDIATHGHPLLCALQASPALFLATAVGRRYGNPPSFKVREVE